MALKSKEQQLLNLLKSKASLSTHELRELGFFSPNTVIYGLRKKGFVIKTFFKSTDEGNGKAHRKMAYYSLQEASYE